jgi:Domain of unknown function (DUF4278)
MPVNYRGVLYQAEPNYIESAETAMTAKFRGAVYRVRRPINLPVNTPRHLVYRGVGYEALF